MRESWRMRRRSLGTKRRPKVRKRRTRPEEKPLSMAREDGPGMAARMVARMRKANQSGEAT